MKNSNFACGAAFVLAAMLFLGVGASQANAWWGWNSCGSWGGNVGWGSWGGHGSYGAYGSHGGYASHGGWGSWGGWNRHHYHRPVHYSYNSCGSHGGYTYTGYGSYGSAGGVVVESPTFIDDGRDQPAPPDPPTPPQDGGDGDFPPPPGDDGAQPLPPGMTLNGHDAGALTVTVPTDAKVFVNGKATTSTGAVRTYVSRGLKDGYRYNYEVRAVIERNGETIESTKSIDLRAGDISQVAFDLDNRVETSLTLHVPADAKVYLSGVETRASGEKRVFATSKLAEGQKWGDYTVRVELNREGRLLAKQQKIELRGGDQRELRIDFDDANLAAR